MAKIHEPAESEDGEGKPTKGGQAIFQAFGVGFFGHDAQHRAGKERKEQSRFEVGEIDLWHGDLFLPPDGDFKRIDDGEDIEQSGGDKELGSVVDCVAGDVGLAVAEHPGHDIEHAIGYVG